MQKFIRYSAIIVLISLVSYSLFLVGSPKHARNVLQDADKINELANIHCELQRYYLAHGSLPTSLEANDLNKPNYSACKPTFCNSGAGLKPGIHEHYTYAASSNNYKICAKFDTTWKDIKGTTSAFYPWPRQWEWASKITPGENCFERTLEECKPEKTP